MLLLLVCIAGIFLGLHFNVLVLPAVSLIGSVVFVFVNLYLDLSFFANVSGLLCALILMQAGYMLGLTGRDTYLQILARFRAAQSNRI
jgi:hypothetical protein